MRYAKYEDGKLSCLGQGPELPEGMVEITEEQYRSLLEQYNRAIDPDPVATARKRILDAYRDAMDSYAAGYSEWEIKSWLRQESEARATFGDRTWIAAAAEAEGITEDELISKIKAKAEVFTFLHANSTGKLHKLLDAIKALGDNPKQEDLDNIEW